MKRRTISDQLGRVLTTHTTRVFETCPPPKLEPTATVPRRHLEYGQTEWLYRAVVKADGIEICECIHLHRNRDINSWDYVDTCRFTAGKSARTCAEHLVELIRRFSGDAYNEARKAMSQQ